MEKKYYITTGQNETEKHQIYTGYGVEVNGYLLEVMDEISYPTAENHRFDKTELIEISKEDYEELAEIIGNWTAQGEQRFYKKADELVNGKYHIYGGEPWKDENGWSLDLMVPECLTDVDALIAGLQAWKEEAKVYYEKKDNELARRVNGAISNNAYYPGPGITSLLPKFVKLGYIDKKQLSHLSQGYIQRLEDNE